MSIKFDKIAPNDEEDENGKTTKNYEKAHEHWNTAAMPDLDGMLGGFGQLHLPDINGSKQFLCELRKKGFLKRLEHALDCGSGIGRVTKHLLLPIFHRVDMVDFAEQHIHQSYAYIVQPSTSSSTGNAVGHRFIESLHTFEPKIGRYDLIWVQWVTGQLQLQHMIDFLKRCKASIRPRDGCIVVKDNVANGLEEDFDKTDQSWTRPRDMLYDCFEKAGCRLVLERRQLHFPRQIYEVRMFALKPSADEEDNG